MPLVVASGCSSMMYLIVWDQLLRRAGAPAPVSLAVFFGGLCIGSLVVPRWKITLPPLKLYAYLEAGLAIFGLLLLLLLPLTGPIGLSPPAIFMGASFAAVARRADAGLLSGGAAAGAALGCLLAGFYVLPNYDQIIATLIAAALHLLVAAVALKLAPPEPLEPSGKATPSRGTLIALALTSAGAAGATIVWTRLLSALMGSTAYASSILFAALWIGIAVGSIAGAWTARTASPRTAFGVCQMLLVLGIFWTSYTITASLPYWPINPFLADSPRFTAQLDMARALWTLLPPALLWGASFSLALAAAARGNPGRVCAVSFSGPILGILATALILVPWIGAHQTQRLILILSTMSVVAAFASLVPRNKAVGSLLVSLPMLALLFASWIPPVPGEFIAYGRQMPGMLGQSEILFMKEGVHSSVAVSRWSSGAVYLNVNGHIEATTEVYDLALQRMLGHLPGILHPDPKSVLGLGFGAGISAGAFTRYPGIEKITIVENEPVIPEASAKYFAAHNYEVASEATIVHQDARRFIFTTPQTFDIVAADPNDVFAEANAALYTLEFFRAVKARLNPGGFFTLYLPLYESDALTVQSQLATFFAAFPNATVWANTREGQGYDMVLLGPAGPLKIDLDAVHARLARAGYEPVVQSLREAGFNSALDLFGTYAGGANDLGRWFGNAEVTRDSNLRLMYLAGRAIHSAQADAIYREMLRYREAPEDLFQGSPAAVQQVLTRLGGRN